MSLANRSKPHDSNDETLADETRIELKGKGKAISSGLRNDIRNSQFDALFEHGDPVGHFEGGRRKAVI